MENKKQELQVKEEQSMPEVEYTRSRKVYVPRVDIAETGDGIMLVADMPGVDEKNVDITLEQNILTITGTVDPDYHKDYRIAYAEYNVGDYRRSFTISSDVDRNKIKATVKNGVLKLILPKAEPAKTKKIKVRAV